MERNLSIILSVALCVLWRADRYAGCRIEINAALIQHHPCPCIATCHLASSDAMSRCIMFRNNHVVICRTDLLCGEKLYDRGLQRLEAMLYAVDRWSVNFSSWAAHIYTSQKYFVPLSLINTAHLGPPPSQIFSDVTTIPNSQAPWML